MPAVEDALRADIEAARSPSPAARRLDHKLGGPASERRYTAPSYELSADGRSFAIPGFNPIEAYEAALANFGLSRRAKPESVERLLAWAGEPLATVEVIAIMQTDAGEDARRAGEGRRRRFQPAPTSIGTRGDVASPRGDGRGHPVLARPAPDGRGAPSGHGLQRRGRVPGGRRYLLLALARRGGCALEVDARRLARRPRPGSSTPDGELHDADAGRGPDLRPHAARPAGRVLVRDALLAAPGRRRPAHPRRGAGRGGADAARGLRRRADGLALRAHRQPARRARHRAPGRPASRTPTTRGSRSC